MLRFLLSEGGDEDGGFVRSYVRLGRIDEARAVIDRLLENEPGYTVENQIRSLKGKFRDPSAADRFVEDLRLAGLPG